MILRQLFDHETFTFTYIIGDETSRAAVIIDPVKQRVPQYVSLLRQLDLRLIYSLETHIHADHITGGGLLREQLGCKTLVGEPNRTACSNGSFQDGQVIRAGELAITALHTPGHTDDSYCFLLDDHGQSLLFTGDTLLIRGSGRTDFQNGSARDQYRSIFGKLLILPDHTEVLPGHDYHGMSRSTIGEERRHNPRLQVQSETEYVSLMENLTLANPKYMDVAVPANLACGQS